MTTVSHPETLITLFPCHASLLSYLETCFYTSSDSRVECSWAVGVQGEREAFEFTVRCSRAKICDMFGDCSWLQNRNKCLEQKTMYLTLNTTDMSNLWQASSASYSLLLSQTFPSCSQVSTVACWLIGKWGRHFKSKSRAEN